MIIISILIVSICACIYLHICNETCFSQRGIMLDAAVCQGLSANEQRSVISYFEEVSYDSHWWYLIIRKSPYDLYNPKLMELMDIGKNRMAETIIKEYISGNIFKKGENK